MDKLLDAVLKIIPAYLVVAITGSAAAFFVVYFWRGYRTYADVIRDRSLWSAIIIIAAVAALYAVNVQRVPVGERPLIIIPYFRNDDADQFRVALGSQIEAALASLGSRQSVMYVDSFIADQESALETAKRFGAAGVIYGPSLIREKDETRCSFRLSTVDPALTTTYPIVPIKLPKDVIDDIVLSISTAQPAGSSPALNPILARLEALERVVSELRAGASAAPAEGGYPQYSAKHAFIVGVDRPAGVAFPPLASAESDAVQFSQLLQSNGYSTEVLLGSAATRGAVLSRINAAAHRKPDELFVFYFAGHATRVKRGEALVLYFVLYDTTETNVSEHFSIRDLEGALKKLPQVHKLAILDTVNGTSGLEGNLGPRSHHPPGAQVLQFLSGCQDEQWAAETHKGGMFTQNLLSVWREANSDTSLPELINRTAKRMATQKALQDPKLLTVEGTGTIYPLSK